MLLAPVLGAPPREIAGRIAGELEGLLGEDLERVEVAGPGFLNLVLSDAWHQRALRWVLDAGERFGAGGAARPERILIEFVSANPTGPLVAASGRHAAYGDALARILEHHGHSVDREYYFNDAGNQIRLLGESVRARARGEEVPEGGYQGEYVADLAASIPDAADADVDELSRGGGRGAARADQGDARALWRPLRRVLQRAHAARPAPRVALERALAVARRERPRVPVRWRARGCARRTSATTRIGSWCAPTASRPTWPPTSPTCRTSASAGSSASWSRSAPTTTAYAREMKAAMAALGGDPDTVELPLLQFVHLVEGGEVFAMSKRRGDFVTLDDLLDEIGVDATRFFMLRSSHDRTLELDVELARKQSRENPVYYVQYAHARIASMLRRLPEERVAAALSVEWDAAGLEDLRAGPDQEAAGVPG